VALDKLSIAPAFAGVTVIAWVPSLVEVANAVAFARQNNISLSFEIGLSAAIQVRGGGALFGVVRLRYRSGFSVLFIFL
jgi:Ca2+/H+ antiporter